MNVLIVYDTAFGNTEKVAQAMAAVLGCEARRAGEVLPEQLTGLEALIVGSPTQAFQPLPSVKTFLQRLPAGALQGVAVAAFDTRVDVTTVKSAILTLLVKLFGYAAEPIGKHLVKKGGTQALPPAGFFVEDKEGPLREGELERAASWARQILKG